MQALRFTIIEKPMDCIREHFANVKSAGYNTDDDSDVSRSELVVLPIALTYLKNLLY